MPRKIPEIITEKEFQKVFKATPKKHHKIAFALGFYGCMRISEIINLRPEHIDKGRRIIMIKQGKGSKDRNIPIPPECVHGLSEVPIKCGVRALQIAFKTRSHKELGKSLHFHILRHSGATMYLNQRGWNTRQVQQLLGHSRLDTTEIYTHVTPDDLISKMWEDKK